MREETFPVLDPTHPLGPRAMLPLPPWADEPSPAAAADASRHPRGGRDVSRVDQTIATRQLPAVPDWVEDREKWLGLDRATRRQLERHHRRQQR